MLSSISVLRLLSSSVLLLVACAPRTTPSPPAHPAVPVSEAEAEPEHSEAAVDPLAEASALIEASGHDSSWLSEREVEALSAHGLDAELATAATIELARRCRSVKEGDCSPHAPKLHVEILLDVLEAAGTPAALPALIQLDERGYFASRPIEAILARRMEADARPCTPPDADELVAARASLEGFVVVERKGARLVPRPLTEAERDDLAYFYAGIGGSAPPIGEGAPHAVAPSDIDPVDAGLRREQLTHLSESLQDGDLATARASAAAYLGSLGYPGPLDAAREADQTWGGARFSYVMRDLALVSEVVGELTTAADLYGRANPGGGMCGTSVDYRRGKQLRGFIRSQERLGQCRAVVAHRLLDWEDEYEPGDEAKEAEPMGYGPVRLVRDGWDVARMYRGALLTRNRGDEAALRRALRDDEAALHRLDRVGPEHWEHRVRAAEGLADVVGREAMDELAALLPQADDALRRRTIEAMGDAARRGQAGPCDEDSWWYLGNGGSNIWSRSVSAFGRSCRTQLDDDEAAKLADRLLPFTRRGAVDVRAEAVRAVGKLAVPRHERMVSRWLRQAKDGAKKACKTEDGWSQPCQDAREELYAAEEAFDSWARANGRDED